jgi:hypothetical protein
MVQFNINTIQYSIYLLEKGDQIVVGFEVGCALFDGEVLVATATLFSTATASMEACFVDFRLFLSHMHIIYPYTNTLLLRRASSTFNCWMIIFISFLQQVNAAFQSNRETKLLPSPSSSPRRAVAPTNNIIGCCIISDQQGVDNEGLQASEIIEPSVEKTRPVSTPYPPHMV